MATRAIDNLRPSFYGSSLRLIRWSGLLNGDDGEWLTVSEHRDISVHFFGSFGAGGTVILEGSNESVDPPTSAVAIHDTSGAGPNPVSATAAKIQQVHNVPHKLRPRVTAGDGATSITVIVRATRGR